MVSGIAVVDMGSFWWKTCVIHLLAKGPHFLDLQVQLYILCEPTKEAFLSWIRVNLLYKLPFLCFSITIIYSDQTAFDNYFTFISSTCVNRTFYSANLSQHILLILEHYNSICYSACLVRTVLRSIFAY